MAQAEHAAGRLAHHGEGLGQQLVQRRAVGQARPELVGLGAQRLVGQRLHRRLQRVDLRHPALVGLQRAVVAGAEDGAGDACAEHPGREPFRGDHAARATPAGRGLRQLEIGPGRVRGQRTRGCARVRRRRRLSLSRLAGASGHTRTTSEPGSGMLALDRRSCVHRRRCRSGAHAPHLHRLRPYCCSQHSAPPGPGAARPGRARRRRRRRPPAARPQQADPVVRQVNGSRIHMSDVCRPRHRPAATTPAMPPQMLYPDAARPADRACSAVADRGAQGGAGQGPGGAARRSRSRADQVLSNALCQPRRSRPR